ncbi:MAG: membrane dipeptidase [Clostridia bacterium]|nr:membrane dipeptidase [Clostridia bacterium]
MKYSLFDTHCDTAFELYHRKEDLWQNSCHISLSHAAAYEKYVQLYAIWCNRRQDDQTCWEEFLAVSDNFDRLIEQNSDKISRVRTSTELAQTLATKQSAAILAVEDARLLAGDIDRLQILYDKGVRCMTLLWGGPTCIGGSHDTDLGLTDFGKAVVAGCFELGIVPDISHASEQSVDDVIAIAQKYQKPFIATHSNCYSVYPHSRNLRDRHLQALIELGGLVGISMCCSHLRDCSQRGAGIDDVIRHIDRYVALDAESNLCFGCDFDGTDLPEGIYHVDDLYKIGDGLAEHGYTKQMLEKLFWTNAYTFFNTLI